MLNGWPTATTTCRWCYEEIQYVVYKHGDSGPRRSVPYYHNGHCRNMGALTNARKTIVQCKRKAVSNL